MKKFLLFIPICVFMFTVSIFATERISPALDVIAYENEMVKAGVVYDGEITFDVNDFDNALGTNAKSITVKTLPDENEGRLMVGNLYVVENQVIYREDFPFLKFIPKANKEGSCSFTFVPNKSGYAIHCTLKIIDSTNFSPVATNGNEVYAWTQTDISTFGTLKGYDPDGDSLRFEITSLPKKGLIEITNTSTGDYKYTPYEKANGSDSFTYRVRDCNGNYSEEIRVNMNIKKLKADFVFSDMKNSTSLNAAIIVTDNDLMKVSANKDGTLSFKPKENVTKEEFIVLVMRAMGARDVPVLQKTRFADDQDIKDEYKGYIEGAFSLGIIEGERKADGIHINPKGNISIAEAAVIINRIIGAEASKTMTVFHDMDDIPAWALKDITSLTELGILSKVNGKINPNSPLTREQTAKILMSLLEYQGKLKH